MKKLLAIPVVVLGLAACKKNDNLPQPDASVKMIAGTDTISLLGRASIAFVESSQSWRGQFNSEGGPAGRVDCDWKNPSPQLAAGTTYDISFHLLYNGKEYADQHTGDLKLTVTSIEGDKFSGVLTGTLNGTLPVQGGQLIKWGFYQNK
jgi:hypothetical protein